MGYAHYGVVDCKLLLTVCGNGFHPGVFAAGEFFHKGFLLRCEGLERPGLLYGKRNDFSAYFVFSDLAHIFTQR